MAELRLGGVQPYTISLDNIDLMHLSKYVRDPQVETPLWTKRYLDGETEYCQVQIGTQDAEDCYSEPSETYSCQICSIDVPIKFTKQHNESIQHETYKNIFQKVLERLSKQININTIENDNNFDAEAYYCEPCSKIIKVQNKMRHESSSYHVKSLKEITIVKEFYKIINGSKITEVTNATDEHMSEESDYEYEISKSTQNKKYKLFDGVSNSTLDSDDDDSVDLTPFTNYLTMLPVLGNSETESKIEIRSQPIQSNYPQPVETESFEDYLKKMIKKFKLKVNLPAVNGDSVCLMTKNGNKVNVSREHFQSFRALKNSTYCQMCKMWISQETKAHEITEIHVRHIFSPINENFARKIDMVSNHCVVCNEVVLANSNHHTLNDSHKDILKETRIYNTSKTFCDDCNIYIDSHNYSVHLISKKHINVLMQKNSITHLDEDIILCFCNVCNMNVHKNNLKSHINTKTHLTKNKNDITATYNKNNDGNKLNNKSNDSAALGVKVNDTEFCNICKVKVPKGGMTIHVDGKPHKTVMSNKKLNSKEGKVQNGVKTNGAAPTGTNHTNNAITATTSKNIATNNCKENKIDKYYDQFEFTDNSKTKVKCKICYITIFFAERNIIDHIEGKSHVEIANKIKMNKYNKLLFYTDDTKTKVKCEICDVNIPLVDRNIIEHMEGRNHLTGVEEVLKFHLIKPVNSGFICECCNINTNNYIEHIKSRDHIMKFLKEYEINKNEMRKYVYENDVCSPVGRCHRELHKNLMIHNNICKIDDFNYYCAMCQVPLGRISEIYHVLGERHRMNLD